MPGREEVFYYLNGLWLLIRGRSEGFQWLDLSDRGFWRSWWAIFYCLPPILLDLWGTRAVYLQGMPENTHLGNGFWSGLLFLDLLSWTAPYAILYAAMSAAGYASRFRPAVILLNWLSVPVQWMLMAISASMVVAPENIDVQASIALVLYLVSGYAHVMVMLQLTERKALPATAFVIAITAGSMLTQYYAIDALGLSFG
ncbi:hypothetical protein [Rhizobium sp. TRM95796]|uniref:hypothetical protein n=1 Tax=Rhizobium sp. TRM95796 TaxID=2979862 RepID=UPI0021E7B52F|nr:hypothetical protein [Rhizobium sp. TRM95796]MCV3766958.1 hypothetical protein [Rhizobium sp. TRM95796]